MFFPAKNSPLTKHFVSSWIANLGSMLDFLDLHSLKNDFLSSCELFSPHQRVFSHQKRVERLGRMYRRSRSQLGQVAMPFPKILAYLVICALRGGIPNKILLLVETYFPPKFSSPSKILG